MTERAKRITSAAKQLPTSELHELHATLGKELASRKPLPPVQDGEPEPLTSVKSHFENGRAFDWHALCAGRAYVMPVWLRAYVHTKHGEITELVECDEVHRPNGQQPVSAVFRPMFAREERSTRSVQRFRLYAVELGDARRRFGKDAFALARAESIVNKGSNKRSPDRRPATARLKQSERDAMALLSSFTSK